MKIKIVAFAALIVLFSCAQDEFNIHTYPQKWMLIRMTGNFPNSETTGEDMPWQESYLFNSDQTFKKQRQYMDSIYYGNGTFSITYKEEGRYLELTFEADSEIIGNCTSLPNEVLIMKSPSKLVNIWDSCDGPGLEYTRVE